MRSKQHRILSAPVIQSGDKTSNRTIDRRWFTFALSGLLFASLLALSPSQASAQCKQWDVSGNWWAEQSNKSRVQFELHQSGTQFTGTVTGDSRTFIRIAGTIKGNRFKVSVKWRAGSEAVYTGTIDANGKITGRTSEYFSGAKATWYSNAVMKCADETEAASIAPQPTVPPVKPRPIKSSGKAKPSATPPNPH